MNLFWFHWSFFSVFVLNFHSIFIDLFSKVYYTFSSLILGLNCSSSLVLKCKLRLLVFRSFFILLISQFSHSVVSNFLQPHGLQHARPPCPSPTPGIYSNSCPFSWWCHLTISSTVVPFSSCLQYFPASGSFPMSQFFASGGQSTGVSASASVLLMNIQNWFPLALTDWISLQSKDSQESSPTPQFKSISSSVLSFLYSPTLTSIHDCWKNHSFD